MAFKSLQAVKDVMKFMIQGKGPAFDSVLKEVKVLAAGDGNLLCEMKVDESHQNRGGTLHGGLTATIVDTLSTAALMTTGEGKPGVSVDLSVSYMGAAKVGEDILIDSKTLKVGRTLAFLTVDISRKSDGKLLASGKHTKHLGS